MTTDKQRTLAQSVLAAAEVDVAGCYQCGKCTAGCPMAKYMDMSPNQVMRLVQIGTEQATEQVLSSTAIWACAGCITCTQRCPQKLDPAAVMDVLREMSYERGLVSPKQKKVLAFHEAFLKTIESTGRMNEMPLVQRYKLASRDLFSDVAVAPAMILRGKLGFRSHKVKARQEIKKIFASCRKRGAR